VFAEAIAEDSVPRTMISTFRATRSPQSAARTVLATGPPAHLAPRLETVFMVPSLDTTYISSSLVREVARFRGDVSGLVHPVIAEALRSRLQGE